VTVSGCTGAGHTALGLILVMLLYFFFHTAPLSPSYVHIVNQMQTNLTIEWGHPDLLNGVLRSFLVTLEEIESFNSSACCEYFPVQEVSIQSEKMNYRLEVSFTKIMFRIECRKGFSSSTWLCVVLVPLPPGSSNSNTFPIIINIWSPSPSDK